MNDKHDSLDARDKEVTESRREFLKKAGRFAVYTPPAVMLLMQPSHATMMQSGIVTKPPTPPDDKPEPPQFTGTLKEYISRTGQFEINSYRAQQAAVPANLQQPWIEMRKSWWSSFWSKAFGGS